MFWVITILILIIVAVGGFFLLRGRGRSSSTDDVNTRVNLMIAIPRLQEVGERDLKALSLRWRQS